MIKTFCRNELKDVLLEPKAAGVKEPYFTLFGEGGQNVTIVSPGKNGQEFNKTYGHRIELNEAVLNNIAYGQGLILLQRNDEEGEAKEFRVLTLRAGVTVEVPAGYEYSLVNVGKSYLVVVDNAPPKPVIYNTEHVKSRHGLAYFVIDKKGEVNFEENPNYRIHPQITMY